jgi:translocation and assembly module TamB
MTENGPPAGAIRAMKNLLRRVGAIRWQRWAGWVLLTAVVLVIAFQATIRTSWFQNKVRERVITELERATGGKVELGTFVFDPSRMTIVITRLVIRGTEQPPAPPLLRVPLLRVELGLVSLLSPRVSVNAIHADSPEAHLRVLEDGTTNLPGASPEARSGAAASDLIDLAVGRLEIQKASLNWNNTASRFNITAENVEFHAAFEPPAERYAASLQLGSSLMEFGGLRPVVSEGKANLYLYRDHLEAQQVELMLEGSTLEAEARLENWERPRLAANYKLHALLDPWIGRAQLSVIETGKADATGQVSWSLETPLTYVGKAEATVSLAANRQRETTPIRIRADYSGEGDRAAARNVEVSAFGGFFRGEAEVEQLLASGGPQWRLLGDFDGFTIRSAIQAARGVGLVNAAPGIPWRSNVSGWVRAEGVGTATPDVATSLIFAGGEATPPQGQPLDGVVDLAFDGASRGLQVSRVDLHTAATRISATGGITSTGSSALDLRMELQDLTDLAALSSLAGADLPQLPLSFQGEGSITGRLAGRLFLDRWPQAEFTGRLEARDFTTAGYRWNTLSSAVIFSPTRLGLQNARLESDTGSAGGEIEVSLAHYRPSETGEIRGTVTVKDLSLEPLLALAGRKEALRGRVSGLAALSGTVENPHFAGNARVTDAEAWGEQLDTVILAARYEDARIEVSNLELAKDAGRVTGHGELAADHRFRFDLSGKDWRLGQIDQLLEGGVSGGELQLELHAAGRLSSGGKLFDELDVSGNWGLEGASLRGEPFGSLSGTIATTGTAVKLDWQAQVLGGQIQGEVESQPAGDQSFRGTMKLQRVAALGVARLIQLPIEELEGEMDGAFDFSGDLADASRFKAEGTITRLEVGLAQLPGAREGYSLWNPFPMRWSLSEGKVQLDGMRLLGQGTDIAINGSVPFAPARPADRLMDLSVDGDFNLSVIESFRPGVRASGISTVQVNVRGTMDDPQFRGRLLVRNGSLRSEDLPNSLSDMTGTLTFTGRRVRIEELRASSGGGTVAMSGTATYEEGAASYRIGARQRAADAADGRDSGDAPGDLPGPRSRRRNRLARRTSANAARRRAAEQHATER